MTDKNLTEIVIIIDRSGSMHHLQEETITGFNVFLDEQQKLEGKALLTLVQFDDQYELIHDAVNVQDVPLLNEETYRPRGYTALLDAIGKTVSTVGDRLKGTPEGKRPSKVIFLIITDGYENDSKEFGRSAIKKMISHQEDKYSWKFTFMGANQDSIVEGASIGISAAHCADFNPHGLSVRSVYSGASSLVSKYRTTGSLGNTQESIDNALEDIENEDEETGD